MSWELLLYFMAFVLQAALMGITMFTVPTAAGCLDAGEHERGCKTEEKDVLIPIHRHFAAQLIKLSDLENDFINPHDATSSINAWVVRMTARRF